MAKSGIDLKISVQNMQGEWVMLSDSRSFWDKVKAFIRSLFRRQGNSIVAFKCMVCKRSYSSLGKYDEHETHVLNIETPGVEGCETFAICRQCGFDGNPHSYYVTVCAKCGGELYV